MTIAETLGIVAVWCAVPTPYRLETKHVNTCREAMLECIGIETLAKAASLQQFEKELGRKTLQCAKERKLPE